VQCFIVLSDGQSMCIGYLSLYYSIVDADRVWIECGWSADGVRIECGWSADGVRMECGWSADGVRMECG
jgi:hypothetical protein